MFTKARLKLTGWYLLMIMLVSVSFSVVMYEILTIELDRVERLHKHRQEVEFSAPIFDEVPLELRKREVRMFMIDPEVIEDAKRRLILSLSLINLGILAGSSLAGWFLAGRTLRPIKVMVDEQNRFVTDASHELRTPITSLKTEIEVNLRDKELSENAKKILRSNLEDVNNLQMLSDNLIKLTQYQDNNGNVVAQEISLKDIVDDASRKVANFAKNKKIEIVNKTTDREVSVNEQSFREALVILIDNAIKYSPKDKKIVISSKVKNNLIYLEVKDQGIGINEKDLPYIFDRFYRADESRTKKDVDGFGLGLSIAKQIIERHKGTITVTSKVGSGTSFVIKLPIK